MSAEFVISPKSLDDSALLVSNCAFHPHEPVLACAVQGGPVRLYQQPDAVGSIVPLSKWKETVFNPVSTQYPVSDASCLQWDVSCCWLEREILIRLTCSPGNWFKKNQKGGREAISSRLRKRNTDPVEWRGRMSFAREAKAHGQNREHSMESNPDQCLRQRQQQRQGISNLKKKNNQPGQ